MLWFCSVCRVRENEGRFVLNAMVCCACKRILRVLTIHLLDWSHSFARPSTACIFRCVCVTNVHDIDRLICERLAFIGPTKTKLEMYKCTILACSLPRLIYSHMHFFWIKYSACLPLNCIESVFLGCTTLTKHSVFRHSPLSLDYRSCVSFDFADIQDFFFFQS